MTYKCPSCGSDNVEVESVQAFKANTGELAYEGQPISFKDDDYCQCAECNAQGLLRDWRGEA